MSVILPADVVAATRVWEQAWFPTAAVDNASIFHAYLYLPGPTDNAKVPYSAHQFYKFHGDPLSVNYTPTVEYEYTLQLYSMFLFGSMDDPVGVLDKRMDQWVGAFLSGQVRYIGLGITPSGGSLKVEVAMGDPEKVNYQLTENHMDVGMQVLNSIRVRQSLPTGV